MGVDRQRLGAVEAARLRRHLPHVQRLHARPDPARGADAAAGHFTSSPTIRSASARTARRISRSSNWPRCALFPNMIVLRPADANEVSEAYKLIMRLKDRPAAWSSAGRNCRPSTAPQFAAGRGPRPRRLRAGRCADGEPEVILIATGSEVQLCVRAFETLAARRRPGAGRQHAELGIVRAAGRGLSRRRAAARGQGPRYRRNGRRPSDGIAMPDRPAQSSACTASALPARSRTCLRNSASLPIR